MENILFLFLVLLVLLPAQPSVSTLCHPKCQCLWRKNKQTAECAAAGFEKIPMGLTPSIQVLNLTRNNFTLLPQNAFLSSGLVNLQKLYLAKCGIEHIDDFALNRISNLIELELSDNLIAYIPTAALRHLPLLRHLILNGNPLVIIPSQAFVELKTLIILEISNCKIDTIAGRAFEGLEKLEVLKIDNNELQTLHAKTMMPFKFLHGITLDGNPWTCDCELRGLRQWLHDNNVPYIPPTCFRPVRLRDKVWTEVNIEEYACAPIFLNTSSAINVFEGSNVTLECKVSGDPIPSIQWLWRERVISNLSEGISTMQTFIMSEYTEKEKHSRLRISSVQEPNAGVYTCVASNTAGTVSKNFTLMVSRIPLTGVKIIEEEKTQEIKEEERSSGNSATGLAIGVISGAVIVLLIMISVLYFCHRRRQRNKQRKRLGASHKVGNSVNPTSPQDDLLHKLRNQNSSHQLERHPEPPEGLPPRDLEQYDNTEAVWKISDHRSSRDVPWDDHNFTINPSLVVKKSSQIPIESKDIHLRLQHELSNTMRMMSLDRKLSPERERGDGSSDMDAIETEIKITFDPHTIREETTSRLTTFFPDKIPEAKGPDLIDHTRTLPGGLEDWKNGFTQPWIYDQDPHCYRPSAAQPKSISTSSRISSDEESVATQV